MPTTAVNMGPLSCTLVRDPEQIPTALVVLCHGYGATGRDLVALADVLSHAVPKPNGVCFLFPQAPLSLAEMGLPAGRAWWHLDAAALMLRAQRGEAARLALQEETFPGLPAARRQLRAAIDAALLAFDLSYAQLTLGGFSQGAMLSTDLALRLEEPPAALVVLSGTLIDAANWRRLAAKRRGLRVLQSHGETDPILPYAGATALRELLEAAGCAVDFLGFPGGHTIVPEAVERCAALLAHQIGR